MPYSGSQYVTYVVSCIVSFVFAVVFHEVAHGFMAYKLGDPTAKSSGRLSFNPIRHIDIFGTIILPLALLLMKMPIFGYAKPVPYNPSYFKDPRKGDLLVGLAGPCTNVILALIGAGIMWIFFLYKPLHSMVYTAAFLQGFFFTFLTYFVLINLVFAFFNILPIPPLDGSSILIFFVPKKYLSKYYRIQQYALPIFFVVAIAIPYLFNVNPIGMYINATAGNIANVLLPY